MLYKKIKTGGIEDTLHGGIEHVLHLPGGQRIIIYSKYGSFRVWDLERGVQVGEVWEDKERGVQDIAMSPDGKTVASGSSDGAVRLWNIDTGRVIKKWTEHTKTVKSVCWSSDGRRVLSGSEDGTFRVWDVESGTTIFLGPVGARESIFAVCYSPDAKMNIATGGDSLKIWDASTGELLTTIDACFRSLAWTSDGTTLIAGADSIRKFDTITWTETAVFERTDGTSARTITLSPGERILASISGFAKTVQLWDLESNQLIAILHHEGPVRCAAFSADGMFLITGSVEMDAPIFTWDVSAIIKEANRLSDNVNATRCGTPRTFPSESFWRRHFDRHGETEHDTQSWSSWTRNSVFGMMRRRDGSDIDLREPPVIEFPCTWAKPGNYHARKKRSTSPSRPSNTHTQQHIATQGTSSSQQLHPTATASTLPAVVGAAGTTGRISHPHIVMTGWRIRLMAWVCCMPIQNAD